MENVAIPGEKIAEEKNLDQGLTLPSKHRIFSETLLPVWKRISLKIGDIFQVNSKFTQAIVMRPGKRPFHMTE